MLNMKRILTIAILTMAVSFSNGQSATDHPNLKSNGQRTGINVDVINSNPGFLSIQTATTTSSLRWFRPYVSAPSLGSLRLFEISPFQTVIDNTDDGLASHTDDLGNLVGPYDPLPQGAIGKTGAWNIPSLDYQADAPYTLAIRRNANSANAAGFQARNPQTRFPQMEWAYTTPSSADTTDPRVAAVPGALRTFEWDFVPSQSTLVGSAYTVSDDPTPKNYSIWVWIPQNALGRNTASPIYSQRYYVYEVTYGRGRKYVDIVDVDISGGGWVRLGNGGKATQQVFNYDGINPSTGRPYPLSVKLYNTVPRGDDGKFKQALAAGESASGFAVYADAVMFQQDYGSFSATPTSAGFFTADIRVTGAKNVVSINPFETLGLFTPPTNYTTGIVTSHVWNTGVEKWTYIPALEGESAISIDNTSPRFQVSGSFAPATDAVSFRGTDYYKGVVNGAVADSNVLVDPNQSLPDGGYEIYTYLAGNGTGSPPNPNFATAVNYSIYEDGTAVYNGTLNMATSKGWVKLGNRRYSHTQAARLQIVVFNSSSVPGDINKNVMVDAFRFLGGGGNAIKSTPVHIRALVRDGSGADPIERNVVLIADERGRIHCVDAFGDGSGGTRVYWTYPSTPDVDNSTWRDPNLDPRNDTSGIAPNQKFDGQRSALTDPDQVLAEMPTGFDLSTAVVTRLTFTRSDMSTYQRDFLYIGAENGRVYSIAMEGRGDSATTSTKPGTTFRTWTWPQTFPAAPERDLSLGKITSVVAGNVSIAGTPTDVIYVGTESGRMYALKAQGDFDYSGNSKLRTDANDTGVGDKVDDPIWQFPAKTSATVGPITGAPALDIANNRLFFGTEGDSDTPGEMICLDARTGTVNWFYQKGQGITPDPLSWASGPCYAPAVRMNSIFPLPGGVLSPNSLFALNQNGLVYAFNADNGTILWTSDMQSGGLGSLGFTRLNTYDNTSVLRTFPVVTLTTAGGKMVALFARAGDTDRNGTRKAWGFNVEGTIDSTLTVSNKYLFGSTSSGFLFAFSDRVNAGGSVPGDFGVPGYEEVTPNDPAGDAYRNAEVALISKNAFDTLQSGGLTSVLNYTDVINGGATYSKPNGRVKPAYRSSKPDNATPAYEWGESIYLLVYNFPFDAVDGSGNDVAPPQVRVKLTGRDGRPTIAEAKLWKDHSAGDANSGYAILNIALGEGGQNSLPPGDGTLTVSVDSRALGGFRNGLEITVNPATGQLSYRIANPLAIQLFQPSSASGILGLPAGEDFGYTINANDPETVNGAFDIPAGKAGTRLLAYTKVVGHGQTTKGRINVLDRSLLAASRGRGLSGVRIERRDLAWLGQASSVVKPFSLLTPIVGSTIGNTLSSFEDLPTDFPNLSLDYPNIRRENVRIRKDGSGASENPVSKDVTLKPPTLSDGTPLRNVSDAGNRVLVPTPFELNIDVPRFQPSNIPSTVLDANSRSANLGYTGRFRVSVGSNLNLSRGVAVYPYRDFTLGTIVGSDERLTVTTPTVDLGALAGGTGYDSDLDYSAPNRGLSPTAIVNPYTGVYVNMFKPFSVLNEGNVNLLNVRIAKGSGTTSGGSTVLFPWQITSSVVDNSIWLDAATDLWSDIDKTFAPRISGTEVPIVVQKARVGDAAGRALRVNPRSRISGELLNPDPAALSLDRDPRVGVSIPFGMPVGKYSQIMRVIEDSNSLLGATFGDELLTLGPTLNGFDGLEAYSDPTFRLDFTVKETRLTGGNAFVAKAPNGATVTSSTLIDANSINPLTENVEPTRYGSIQPSAARLRNGKLVVAFASNRPTWYQNSGKAPGTPDDYRIFISSMGGQAPGPLGNPSNSINNNVRDLQGFRPWINPSGSNSWFKPSALGPFPAVAPSSLFTTTLSNGVAGALSIDGVVDPATVRYGYPSFPARGTELGTSEPASSQVNTNTIYLGFVGSAYRNTSTGRITDSRIFVTPLNVANDGTVTAGNIYSLDADPTSIKSKPSISLNQNILAITYTTTQSGVSTIKYVEFDLTTKEFSVPTSLPFGSAFESVSDPSISSRFSTSPAFAAISQVGLTSVITHDVAFSGKLRGRKNSSIFMGRLEQDQSGHGFYNPPLAKSPYLPWTYWERQSNEKLVYNSTTGVWSSRGVQWRTLSDASKWEQDANGNYPFSIKVIAPGYASAQDLFDPTVAPVMDRDTGMLTLTSKLGGRMIIDPSAGTIRFTGTSLSRAVDLRLDYQPTFLRVSGSEDSSYTSTNLLFDNRLGLGNETNGGSALPTAFWFNNNDIAAPASAGDRSDRFIVGSVRSAISGGQTSRPALGTLRFGVRLGRSLRTDANGNLLDTIQVRKQAGATNLTGNYQVDPAAGRIYFTHFDEGALVNIVVNGDTANPIRAQVTLIGERTEEPILLDKAVNENGLCIFFDPAFFGFQEGAANSDRRSLLWMIWSSTRGGAPDLYFQGLAPKLTPFIPNP